MSQMPIPDDTTVDLAKITISVLNEKIITWELLVSNHLLSLLDEKLRKQDRKQLVLVFPESLQNKDWHT